MVRVGRKCLCLRLVGRPDVLIPPLVLSKAVVSLTGVDSMSDAVDMVASMAQSAVTPSSAVQKVPMIPAAPPSVVATSMVTVVPIVPASGSSVVVSRKWLETPSLGPFMAMATRTMRSIEPCHLL